MTAPVLLVEDDPDFASSLELALGLIDVKVVRAGSAEEAVALFESGEDEFGMVFCDVKLPGGDGITCLEQLRSRSASLVGVIMTGFRDEALMERARRAGAAEILLKPFRMADFMDLAKKHLAL